MLLQVALFHSFLWLLHTHTHTHILHLLYPSVDGCLGFFHALAIVSSAAMNIGVHVSFQIMVFSRYMPRKSVARSYGSSIFSFFEKPPYYA